MVRFVLIPASSFSPLTTQPADTGQQAQRHQSLAMEVSGYCCFHFLRGLDNSKWQCTVSQVLIRTKPPGRGRQRLGQNMFQTIPIGVVKRFFSICIDDVGLTSAQLRLTFLTFPPPILGAIS